MDADPPERPSRMRWILYGALGAVIAAPIVLGLVWTQRRPIARDLIDDALNKRGVQASYDLTEVGTKLQRIENIVIGDPARPDFTAKWAEVDTVTNFFGWKVQRVRASGVRIKGRLVDGKLNLGSLDKLLPAPTNKPFALPDMEIALTDARMRLDTDFGPVGARLDGRGNLANVFSGKLALAAPRLLPSKDCTGNGVTAFVAFSTRARQISVKGPVRAQQLRCWGMSANGVTLALDATVPERLDAWSGSSRVQVDDVTGPDTRLANVQLQTDFTGDKSATAGRIALIAAGGSIASGSVGRTEIAGTFRLLPRTTGIEADGTILINGLKPHASLLEQGIQLGRAGAGTPVEGITADLKRAIDRLGEGSAAKARFTLAHEGEDGAFRLNGIEATSKSGARLNFLGADPVRYTWRDGGLFVSGQARLAGGGFPTSEVQLAGGDGRWTGTARIAPLVSGEARVVLSPVGFEFGRGGTRVETRALVDGRFGDIRFVGLELPVSMRPGAPLISGCLPLSFNALEGAGFRLEPARLNACLVGNEARIAAPNVAGRFGDARFKAIGRNLRYNLSTQQAGLEALKVSGTQGATPFTLDARAAQYGGRAGTFLVDAPHVVVGQASSRTFFDFTKVEGRLTGSIARGQFSGAVGRIGTVPLNISNGSGNWQFSSGVLMANGGAGIADSQSEARFQPLVTNNFVVRYANGRMTGTATLQEPETGIAVTTVDLVHQLSNATGRAVLDVDGITFDRRLQPEKLTRATLGVIANVEGSVVGRGEVRWAPRGVTSDGRFSTKGMNFAAAFGPVRQLKGEIVFTDLLGLQTAPGQTVTIAEINSGVQVLDGVVRYRLLRGLKAEVEGGRWPFSGGELILEPTVLDLSESAERRLTFRIVALDAAKFINQLQLENISATGTFDGVMPMIFDKSGGRVEAGNLLVREGGGTLSYIGEVSKENLGTYGMIAFDALKSMRFKKLAIDLRGPLDGEMVSEIRFNGVNQAPIVPGRQKLPIPIKIQGLTGIPFIFNITIRAPFRGLVNMARTFQDPSGLIQQELDRERLRQELEKETKADKPVQ